jgi:4-amino-4-deoxy-L-arabinose transferase-like glycosyltransferase
LGGRLAAVGALPGLAAALLVGALLFAGAYQTPARHEVDVGGYDAAYAQGFYDAERADDFRNAPEPQAPPPYLDGSNGSARWSRASSALRFPQAGLPATVSLRVRGWRTQGAPPRLRLLLNGRDALTDLATTGAWQDVRVQISGGQLKASDFFIEIQSDTARLDDGREVGVLLDAATFSVAGPPTIPDPAQVAYGSLAAGLLWLLYQTADRRPQTADRGAAAVWYAVGFLALLLLWLFLYRLQPPLARFPLLWLMPAADGLLAAWLLVVAARRPAVRDWVAARPWLWDLAAGLVVALWLGALLLYARGHVTLAVPGVEKDFRVFATRPDFAAIFRADGFYNLGYPLLLWLARPLANNNAFLAARLLAALFGALLLGAGYALARLLLASRPAALVALVALACSPLVAQYGLYVGSDMPFAALVALALALFTAATRAAPRNRLLLAAGLAAGASYLVRHLGLVLLPWGLAALWLAYRAQSVERKAQSSTGALRMARPAHNVLRSALCAYAAGFLLAAAPQLAVNTAQTGNPLYNQQAKNVWLGVYGNSDFDRWNEAPNDIGLLDVVLRDPPRFLANWGGNLRAFFGTGGEDTSEFGRAIQLRLLGWPANWLALLGVGYWILGFVLRRPPAQEQMHRSNLQSPISNLQLLSLAAFALLYALAVCAAFALPRFFLPLAPLYAAGVGGVWLLVSRRWPQSSWPLVGALALAALLLPGVGAGAGAALTGQPDDEVAAVALVERALAPGDLLLAQLPADVPLAKYSSIAHRAAAWPAPVACGAPVSADALAAARSPSGAGYLLWSDACGAAPLPSEALRGRAGPFALYALP